MEEVIRTLLHSSSQIKFMFETAKTVHQYKSEIRMIEFEDEFYRGNPFDIAVAGIILNYILLKSCGWLDEYNEGFSPSRHPEEKDKIIRIKKILKPAKDRINKWKDLKTYRNEMLAHTYKRKEKYLLTEGLKTKYNIPHTNTEIYLLANLIFTMMAEISKNYQEIIQHIDIRKSINDYLEVDLIDVNVKSELDEIVREIEKKRQL